MLRGRLGLETARIPHADRHGLLWLSRGALTVRDGTLRFSTGERSHARQRPGRGGVRDTVSNPLNDTAGPRLHRQPRRAEAHGKARHRARGGGRGWRPVLHRAAAAARHVGRGAAADAGLGRRRGEPDSA